MKKMKMAVWLLGALALGACEGNTTRDWVISNQTDEALEIEFQLTSDASSNTIEQLEANESITVGTWDQRGGTEDPGSPSEQIQVLTITSESGQTSGIDFRDEANWSIESEHRSKVRSDYYHEFTFTVETEDLE